MARLEIHRQGRVLAYDILDDEVTVGRHESNGVRLDHPDVAGVHLRFLRVDGGFKAEDLCTADGFRVNGVQTREQVLRDGDRIELSADLAIVFVGEPQHVSSSPSAPAPQAVTRSPRQPAPAPVVAPAKTADVSRDVRTRARRGRLKPGRKGPPPLVIVSVVMPLLGICAVLFVSSMNDRGLTGRELLALAESQIEGGALEKAEVTLRMVEAKSLASSDESRLGQVRVRLQQAFASRADRIEVDMAGKALLRIKRFEGTYLSGKRNFGRPAAREMIRELRGWRESYETLCGKYREGRLLIGDIERLEERYAPAAQIAESDTLEDAVFRIERCTYMSPRQDREALARLDAALQAGTLPADRGAAMRASILRDAEKARDERLTLIRSFIEKGDLDRARRQLREMVERSIPETLVQPAAALLADVNERAPVDGDGESGLGDQGSVPSSGQ